jgi:GDP/UDP-N,N'-diacetylbacillosamine 2-epimerase (hydrolysing)
MRKIAVVTGTRAEYGPLRLLMKAIEKSKELKLIPLITGMHLLPEYGNTYKLVEKEFSQSIKIPMSLEGDTLKDMAFYLSSGIKNFATYFSKNPPDIVVVTGDRSEQLAAALAALYLNIPIAHINGGDVSGGTIDESIRHAITKIAHIHLAHTKTNAERIRKMGEEKNRVYVTGTLAVEAILKTKLKSRNEIFSAYNLDPLKTTFLVVQHPITLLKDKGYSEMKELFLALNILTEQTILVYPNCDAGGKKFITLIEKHRNRKYLHIFKNLPHEDYLSFMKSVDVLIGNSSSGIVEAPTLKTPVINIGDRQRGRERSNNILDVKPTKEDIIKSVHYVLSNKEFQRRVKNCVNVFGGGNASKEIINILKNLEIDDKLLTKRIIY